MRHVVFVTGLLINLSSRRASNFIHARNAALALANDFMREKKYIKILIKKNVDIIFERSVEDLTENLLDYTNEFF